jgi:hypothetical protein
VCVCVCVSVSVCLCVCVSVCIGNVKDAATLMIIEVLDMLLVVAAQQGVTLLESSGLLYTLIGMLLNPAEPVLVRATCVSYYDIIYNMI